MRRNLLLTIVVGVAMLFAGFVFGQKKPSENISGKRHPHLAAAQRLSANAYEKIIEAQQANEWDLAGHAQRAKDLLDQANNELKKAAEVANIGK